MDGRRTAFLNPFSQFLRLVVAKVSVTMGSPDITGQRVELLALSRVGCFDGPRHRVVEHFAVPHCQGPRGGIWGQRGPLPETIASSLTSFSRYENCGAVQAS